jgi:Xaa-Pro aminopeptidase
MIMFRYVVLLAAVAGGCASAGVERAAAPAGVASVDAWQPPALPPAPPVGADEFARRRAALLSTLSAGVLVVTGSPPPAHDYLPFAQDHNFRYLTGITEPGAAYIAVKTGVRVEEFLFVQPRDPAREAREGARLGPDGASARVQIPALPATRFVAFLDSVVGAHGVVHVTAMPPRAPRPDANLSHAEQLLARLQDRQPAAEFRSVADRLRQLRARKSAAELDRIRRAVHISALAHREAMRATAPGMNEFEIRALHEYTYLRNGAEGPAYGSIVGSGPNATVLHYGAADRFMEDGELLLVDAAASYGGYAADITRTFPVNGRFSPEQRAVYEVVLAAHEAAAALIRRGATWAELQEAANRELREGMARMGLIDGPDATHDCGTRSSPATCPQFRLFYMHGLGHGVGLAVHDPDVSELDGFQPGSAVTIEPGIYVRADTFDHLPDTPANRAMAERLRPAFRKFVGIGVRIEDVYIFDESGVERASAGAPREIDEIEALMREASFADGSRRAGIVEWYRINQGR